MYFENEMLERIQMKNEDFSDSWNLELTTLIRHSNTTFNYSFICKADPITTMLSKSVCRRFPAHLE